MTSRASIAEVYGFVGYLTSFVAYGADHLFCVALDACLSLMDFLVILPWPCRDLRLLALCERRISRVFGHNLLPQQVCQALLRCCSARKILLIPRVLQRMGRHRANLAVHDSGLCFLGV